MDGASGMKLVFRLAGIGFSLPIADLLEIRDDLAAALDCSAADPDTLLLGRLSWRGAAIPVRDLGGRFGLAGAAAPVALVLAGVDGAWAVAVDRVEGMFPAAEFLPRALPALLEGRRPMPCDRCDLWRGEPLLSCAAAALERCWEGA